MAGTVSVTTPPSPPGDVVLLPTSPGAPLPPVAVIWSEPTPAGTVYVLAVEQAPREEKVVGRHVGDRRLGHWRLGERLGAGASEIGASKPGASEPGAELARTMSSLDAWLAEGWPVPLSDGEVVGVGPVVAVVPVVGPVVLVVGSAVLVVVEVVVVVSDVVVEVLGAVVVVVGSVVSVVSPSVLNGVGMGVGWKSIAKNSRPATSFWSEPPRSGFSNVKVLAAGSVELSTP